jgi:hypothetical protein
MIKEILIEKIDKNMVRTGIIVDGQPRDILINAICCEVKISKKSIAILNMAFKCALQTFNEQKIEK